MTRPFAGGSSTALVWFNSSLSFRFSGVRPHMCQRVSRLRKATEGRSCMRAKGAAIAAIIVTVAVGGFAQGPPQKGGGDETGPYDLVPDWPQNYCGPGFQIGST